MNRKRRVLDVREYDETIVLILEDVLDAKRKRERISIDKKYKYTRYVGKWNHLVVGDYIEYSYRQNTFTENNPSEYTLELVRDRDGNNIEL